MNVTIKIRLESGSEVELSMDEAMELRRELDTLLGERIIDHQPCPLPVDPLPT